MDNEILKLLPTKAFKLLSMKDTFKVTTQVTSSLLNKTASNELYQKRLKVFQFTDIKLTNEITSKDKLVLNKSDGEKILRIYFSQFYASDLAIHLDYRNAFSKEDQILLWKPSKLHYQFSKEFNEGIKALYQGFYLNNDDQFLFGLKQIGIINHAMNESKIQEIVLLFTSYFGDGKEKPIKFSLDKLQNSFNEIFSFFLKNDIPLNPEFAVLGIALVTLYNVLDQIPDELDVKNAFLVVHQP